MSDLEFCFTKRWIEVNATKCEAIVYSSVELVMAGLRPNKNFSATPYDAKLRSDILGPCSDPE
jgi:hypothetical protein